MSLNPEGPQALLSEIISNALPQNNMMKDNKPNSDLAVSPFVIDPLSYSLTIIIIFQYFSKVLQNGSAESSESASTSSIGSNNSSHNKAPGSQLHHHHQKSSISNQLNGIGGLQSTINNNSNAGLLSNPNPFGDFSSEVSKQVRVVSYQYADNYNGYKISR